MDNQPTVITPDNQPPAPVTAPVAPPSPTTPPIKVKHAHTFILGYIAILILVAAIGGIYGWQHKKFDSANARVASLQGQVARLSSNAGSFTYTPHYGNLSLTLPRSYGVIVNNDGCPCNDPYTGFNIVPRVNTTVFNYNPGQNAEITINNAYDGNLNAVVADQESIMKSQGYTVLQVTNTSVAGLPGKLITATSNVREYLIGSGKWLDGIVLNGNQTNQLQTDILKGIVIKK